MSPLLREFLQAWIDWVDAGAAECDSFTRYNGLCNNLTHWSISQRGAYDEAAGDAEECLLDLFKADGLDETYPFGGQSAYDEDRSNGTHHLNPARLAWVRSKVAQKEVV